MKKSSCPSLSFYISNSCPLTTLLDVHQHCSSLSLSFPYFWGSQNETHYTRCHLTSAEQRRTITSLGVPGLLVLMRFVPCVVGSHCCKGTSLTHAQLDVHQDLQVLYIKLISSLVPSLHTCMGLLFPRCRTSHSCISWCFCHPASPACSCPPERWQPHPLAYQLLPIYEITRRNIMKEMIVSLMVLYKLRMEQDWQLCRVYSSTGKHSDAVLHRVADALTFEDETKGWCHLQRQLSEFLWEDLARTSRIKVPFLSLPTVPEIKIISISPKQEAHHLIWEKKRCTFLWP